MKIGKSYLLDFQHNLKWLEKASIFDFKKNTIKVAKTYFGEENVSSTLTQMSEDKILD